MAEITAQAVNEFRKATGLGLMECKALLKEADGDMKKAMTLAKERGMDKAKGRAARSAKAGRIEFVLGDDGKSGAIVEVNCETDFVARNDEFRRLARELAQQVLEAGADATALLDQPFRGAAGQTVREAVLAVNARTGENVAVTRTARFAVGEDREAALKAGRVDAYVHHDAKSGALVEVDCQTEALATSDAFRQLVKDLALQVVAANPLCVRREELPNDVVAEQKRIFVTQAADKPEAVRDKIAEGKLAAWYKEVALLDQEYIKDSSKTIRQMVEEVGKGAGETIAVARFARFVVGENPAGTAEAAPGS